MRQAVAFLGVMLSFAASGGLLAGCTTVNLADAMPSSAATSAPQPVVATSAPEPSAAPSAVHNDLYPDTIMRPAAAEQISEADRVAATADLRARRDRVAGGGSAAAHARSAADLRRIAGSHADETLRAIEGE